MKTANILLVDDDRNFLRVLTYQIQEMGFRVVPCPTPDKALRHLSEESFDLVITDLRMPGMDGLQLLGRVKTRYPDLPVIVLTAFGSIDKAVEAIKGGAYDFLTKPFEKEEIEHTLGNALKMTSLLEENRRLSQAVCSRFQFEGFIGSSKNFLQVLGLAEQLAAVDTTVLIQGESGTGKELLARAIHFNGRRRNRPFVVVNCGAIPAELMESELFGHRKGSFTGAVSDRKGKFETADTGTILLDEVGELPGGMQVKLLRVLQEKEVDMVGEPRPRPVDVRILAATNQDLQRLMRDGALREDLFYRLSVAPLQMPPLRRRREDIPLLAHHFLERFNEKMGKAVRLEPRALAALQNYHWPGNVRELENVIERMMVFDRRGILSLEDLPPQFHLPPSRFGQLRLELPEEDFSLEELERDLLRAALERHDWNQTRAARYLGLSRNTLIYRMHKYRIRKAELQEEGA